MLQTPSMTPQGLPIEDYLSQVAARMDAALRRMVEEQGRSGPRRLWEAVGYALLGGGKRLRPALALATAEALGGESSDESLAMRFAVALEMIHTYSLVHDDLPCMDDDDLRRGRPTVHKVYDEAMAVLVGDVLQSAAFRYLLAEPDTRRAELAELLSCNATRMVEGQVLDLEAETRRFDEQQVLDLMGAKTGALIATAVVGGAIAATGHGQVFYPAGLKLGLAFQIADDLLDITGNAAELGKRVGKDAAAGKATLPSLVGIEEARRRAEEYCEDALGLLETQGAKGEILRSLAQFVVTRRR